MLVKSPIWYLRINWLKCIVLLNALFPHPVKVPGTDQLPFTLKWFKTRVVFILHSSNYIRKLCIMCRIEYKITQNTKELIDKWCKQLHDEEWLTPSWVVNMLNRWELRLLLSSVGWSFRVTFQVPGVVVMEQRVSHPRNSLLLPFWVCSTSSWF